MKELLIKLVPFSASHYCSDTVLHTVWRSACVCVLYVSLMITTFDVAHRALSIYPLPMHYYFVSLLSDHCSGVGSLCSGTKSSESNWGASSGQRDVIKDKTVWPHCQQIKCGHTHFATIVSSPRKVHSRTHTHTPERSVCAMPSL